jgi:hypothetical protein
VQYLEELVNDILDVTVIVMAILILDKEQFNVNEKINHIVSGVIKQ